MTALDADDGVRAVVLTGAGTRAFAAGLDLQGTGLRRPARSARPMREGGGRKSGQGHRDLPQARDRRDQRRQPSLAASKSRSPADVLIASTNARFADTHARVGVSRAGGFRKSSRGLIGISRAKELSFTGNFLDAATAEGLGPCEPGCRT